MSCTTGPCQRCGAFTTYDDREPTPCWRCKVRECGEERIQRIDAAITRAINRKARRAAKKRAQS
ncbi:MAG: hypothetical protein E6R03_01715 [Hyphomicrobiaceae bacterium]|nr:MAG: hypothetical protein E6R03_01715 [Hyphomicrobiaceae bacterium]